MIDSDSATALNRLLAAAQAGTEDTGRLYRACLAIDPGRGDILFALADLLAGQGAIGHARDAYYRADVLLENNPVPAQRLVRLEFRLGLYSECIALGQRLVSRGVIDGNSMFYTAASYHYMGNHDAARAILNRFDPKAQSAGFVAYFQARISYAKNALEDAIMWLHRGIETMDNGVLRLLLNRAAASDGRDLEICAFNASFAQQNVERLDQQLQTGNMLAAADAARAAIYAAPWSMRVNTELDRLGCALDAGIAASTDATERTTLWHIMEGIEAERAFAATALRPATVRTPNRLFDAFIFNDEVELLEYRLDEIGDIVDKVVVVESEWTFQGRPKPLTFQDNIQRFARHIDKIVHVVVREHCVGLAWDHEAYQRNMILRGLKDCSDNDIVIVSDVDEIPRRSTIEYLKSSALRPNDIHALSFRYFRYFLNARLPLMWMRPVALSYDILKSIGPNRARELMIKSEMPVPNLVHDAGWHFSSLGGIETELRKYRENSHIELIDRQPSREELERSYSSGNFSDHWGRLRCMPIDGSFPAFVRANQAALIQKGWIWPMNGPSDRALPSSSPST